MDKVLRKTQQVGQPPKVPRGVEPKEPNITSFYQQKKRVSGNDSFEEQVSSLKKSRKSTELEMPHGEQPIIAWESPRNTSVDCQLKLSESIGLHSSVQETSMTANRNETNMDQMLNAFHRKLQFEGLSKTEDSGNSGSDGISEEDSWMASKDFDKALDELQKNATKPTASVQPASSNSGESGLGSSDSSESDLNGERAAALQSPSTRSSQFKIPETPIKSSNHPGNQLMRTPKATNSVQFFSTPKMVARQRPMNFENLSPIKSHSTSDNSLVNIRPDNKRAFNDSQGEDGASKRRNGKVLFAKSVDENRQTTAVEAKPMGKASQTAYKTSNAAYNANNAALKPNNAAFKANNAACNRKEEELIDDSFDQILSQMDDKAIMSKAPVPPAAAATQNEFDDFDDEDSFDNLLSQMDDKTLLKGKSPWTGRAAGNQFNVHVNHQLYRQAVPMSNQMSGQMGGQTGGQTGGQMRGTQMSNQTGRQTASQAGRPVNKPANVPVESRADALKGPPNRTNEPAKSQPNPMSHQANGQPGAPVNRAPVFRYSTYTQSLDKRP